MESNYEIGKKYFEEKKLVEAEEYLKKAIQENNLDAYNLLAVIKIQNKEFKKAEELLRVAVEENHTKAQANLGQMYFFGNGLERNKIFGMKLLKKAMEKGDENAYNTLGIIEANKGNLEKANEYYEISAQKGNIFAQSNLAKNYFYGKGIEKDFSKARFWAEKAASKNYKPAIELLEKISKEETFNDINTITTKQFNEIINKYKDSMCIICAGKGILKTQECAAFISISKEEAEKFFYSIINDLPENMKQFSTIKIGNLTDIYDFSGLFNGNFKYINVINYGVIAKDNFIKKDMENVYYIIQRLEEFNDNDKIYSIYTKENKAFSPTKKFAQCFFSNILEANQFIEQYNNNELALYVSHIEFTSVIYERHDMLDCIFDGRDCSGWDITEAIYKVYNKNCLREVDIKNIIKNNKLYILASTDGSKYIMRQNNNPIFFTSVDIATNFKERNKQTMTHDYGIFLITDIAAYNKLIGNSIYICIDGEKHCNTDDFINVLEQIKKEDLT